MTTETTDASNWFDTTYSVSPEDPFNGILTYVATSGAADTDWVSATLEADYGYVFSLSGDGKVFPIENAEMTLRTDVGTIVDEDMDFLTGAPEIAVPTAAAGTYFIEIGFTNYAAKAYSQYTLELIREIATGVGTRSTLGLGETSSTLEYDEDEDWFEMTLDANYGYVLRLSGDGSASEITNAYLGLNDASGESLAVNDAGTSAEAELFLTTTASGTYFAQVGTGGSGIAGKAGGYDIELIREIATGVGTRSSATLDRVTHGTLEHDLDEDWFAVELEAGQSYAFTATSTDNAAAITDATVALHDGSGTLLDSAASATDLAAFGFVAETSGTHFIRVGSDDGADDSGSGDYRLFARTDIGASLAGGGERTKAGALTSSYVDFGGDVDSIGVKLGAGKLYDIIATGFGTYAGADNLHVERWGDGAAQKTYATDTALLVEKFKSASAGTYQFRVGDADGDASDVGAYDFGLFAAQYGKSGKDKLVGGSKSDSLHGGAGNDSLNGKAGKDALFGDGGKDLLIGFGGDDMLFGGGKADKLKGGSGNDLLEGGAGYDVLIGGGGGDVFVMRDGGGTNRVKDFTPTTAYERIDLSDVSRIKDYSDLMANHAQQNGDDVVIKSGSGTKMILVDIELGDLAANDFLF